MKTLAYYTLEIRLMLNIFQLVPILPMLAGMYNVGLVKIIKKSLLSFSIQNLASFKTRREEEKDRTIAD